MFTIVLISFVTLCLWLENILIVFGGVDVSTQKLMQLQRVSASPLTFCALLTNSDQSVVSREAWRLPHVCGVHDWILIISGLTYPISAYVFYSRLSRQKCRAESERVGNRKQTILFSIHFRLSINLIHRPLGILANKQHGKLHSLRMEALKLLIMMWLKKMHSAKKRRYWVHPIFQRRHFFGDYYHLMEKILTDVERSFGVYEDETSHTSDSFRNDETHAEKRTTNFRKSLSQRNG